MCVIIHQKPSTYLDKQDARKLWKQNPDGGGFAYIDDEGRIIIEKSMEFESFWRAFERARSSNPKRDWIIHMRIATHGSVCLDNTHPFVVDEHTVMAHNGMIGNVPTYASGEKQDWSDTRVFIDELVKELPETWLDNEHMVSMVEDYIGHSKLMFLTTNPALQHRVYILNENLGTTYKKMWLSNVHGLQKFRTVTQGWSASWDYDDYGYSDWLRKEEPKTNTKELERKRRMQGLKYDVIEVGGELICIGCTEEVDEYDGDCFCYDYDCADCNEYAAECTCENGFSRNLVESESSIRLSRM